MSARLDQLRARLDEAGYDAYFSISPPDNQYLTGFLTDFGEISAGIVVTPNEAHFYTDSRYTEQAHAQVAGFEIHEMRGDLLARCAEAMNALGLGNAAFDPARITVAEHKRLAENFNGTLTPAEDFVGPLRIVKSAEEIATMRQASALAEGVLHDVAATLNESDREAELAARIEYEFRLRGAEGAAFNTIALFGPRSSLPHGIPADTQLQPEQNILFDLGCRYHGYCSDLTRTYAFGTIPNGWFREVYELVLTAQTVALEHVAPGVPCKEVDAAARNVIAEGGYGDYFGHGLGHGVGVEIHEAPRVNPRSGAILEPGMVVTIEPGIYLPGRGGVRIEDLIAVTGDGFEFLSTASKELKVLHA